MGDSFFDILYSSNKSCCIWLLSKELEHFSVLFMLQLLWDNVCPQLKNKNRLAYYLLWKHLIPQSQCSSPIIQPTVYAGIYLVPSRNPVILGDGEQEHQGKHGNTKAASLAMSSNVSIFLIQKSSVFFQNLWNINVIICQLLSMVKFNFSANSACFIY